MIKKSLFTVILLFIGYSIFLAFNKVKWHSAQNQFQGNVIKADRYINATNTPRAIILGSSLSAEIVEDSIAGLYNFAMPGMTILDGCHLLFKRKQLPPTVFIEINYFFKDETKTFTSSFDSDIKTFFKAHLKALDDENQPIGIAKHFLWMRKHQKGNDVQNVVLKKEVFEELLKNQKKYYVATNDTVVQNALPVLKKMVNEIQARGSKVYFFEMPVDTSLQRLPLADAVRQSILNNFVNTPFLPIPAQAFNTIDGIHLNGSDAVVYTRYFKTYADKIIAN